MQVRVKVMSKTTKEVLDRHSLMFRRYLVCQRRSSQPDPHPSCLAIPAFDEHSGPMPQPRAGADEAPVQRICDEEDLVVFLAPSPHAIALQPVMGTGVSFSLRNFGDAVSTLASLPGLSPKLAQLVRTMNLSAMGVLNFQRHLGVSSNTLSAAFRVMDAALKQQSYTEHMVFLGAVLVNKQSRTDFVNEVYNMEHLTTIILQTHVHGDPELPLNESSKDRCRVLPVSAINAQLQHQDFAGAAEAAYSLRMRGDKFRLLFSSTMAVVVFVGDGESDEPMKTNDACERAFMMDLDVTCNDTLTGRQNTYDQTNKYAFATFRHGGHRYFATYESEESLADKLSMYLRTYSDGWAMFEVQRDLWKACRTNDYIRLELVALGNDYRSHASNDGNNAPVSTTSVSKEEIPPTLAPKSTPTPVVPSPATVAPPTTPTSRELTVGRFASYL
ncbi:hypothetical protein MRX96_056176 [Rhipicephalus microplus]